MSVIWKRLQRVNKRAAKYRVVFELQELMVEGTSQWQPNKLSVVLSRRRRRISSQPMHWEPTIRNPYRGLVVWSLPEILDVDVTLYRSMRASNYEDKEWTLAIEEISPLGRPRRIATANINISNYVDEQFGVPSRHEIFKLSLNLTSKKVKEVFVTLVISTQFLKEGKATDYDMESVTSMMSVSANDGVRNLDDDELDIGDHSAETSAQIYELANKFSELMQNENSSADQMGHKPAYQLTDSKSQQLESATEKTDKGPSVKQNCQTPENKAVHYLEEEDEVANIAKEDQTSLSDQGSPSGTFASFAKSARAVINFKSDDSQSVPGYERVTHRHTSPKRHLTADPASQSIKSVDHEGNTSVSVIAPNGAHLETSRVYSRNEQEQHKLSQHLTSRQNASTDADLRSRALDSTGEAHSTSSVVAAATGKSRRNDNRPKWTGPNLDESAFLGERLLSSSNRESEQMPVYSAAEELLSWCQKVTDGYHGVKITNLTTSWRNGLAFCAIIHHFRPDLIDFDSLRPSDVVGNCSMAFEAAFSLGVPKLLEAKDMVAHSVPDRLSVMTYLYQLKSFFVGQTALRPRNGRLSRYNELEEECEEDVQRETVLARNLSQVKSKCLDLFDCFDELDNARYMHKLQSGSDSPSSGNSAHSTAPTTSQMTSAYQEKLKAQNWNDCLDNTRNNNSAPRPFSGDGRATKKGGEMADRHAVDSRTKLMTRNQLMNPFDSDSEEEIELISKNDSKPNHWVLTPSSSSTDSEDNSARSKSNSFSKEPVRKPLQFAASYQNDSRPLPTSYSTSSFPTYRLSSNPTSSVHSGLFKIANEPVEVAPGLLDLSSVKAYRLQRAFSAPTSQHFLIDPRKRPQFREEELRERARQLLENVRKESSANEDINRPHSNSSSLFREQDERQRALRERARKLIADARQGIIAGSSLDSPGSMASNSTTNSTNTPVMSPLEVYSGFEQVNGCSLVDSTTHKYMIKSDFDKTKASQPSSGKAVTDVVSTPKTIPPNKAKLVDFNFFQFNEPNGTEINGNNWSSSSTERTHRRGLSRSKSKDTVEHSIFPDSLEATQQEIERIEKQQKQIDCEAAILEKRLRKVMDTGGNKRLEETLIQNWFVLVNKRNALIRQQMQLNIREKEADMNRCYEELNQELRTLVSVDESLKTDAQRAREKKLLEDLVQIVDKRNELVLHLDNQEKAIEEDELVENATQGPIRLNEEGDKKDCVIQ